MTYTAQLLPHGLAGFFHQLAELASFRRSQLRADSQRRLPPAASLNLKYQLGVCPSHFN